MSIWEVLLNFLLKNINSFSPFILIKKSLGIVAFLILFTGTSVQATAVLEGFCKTLQRPVRSQSVELKLRVEGSVVNNTSSLFLTVEDESVPSDLDLASFAHQSMTDSCFSRTLSESYIISDTTPKMGLMLTSDEGPRRASLDHFFMHDHQGTALCGEKEALNDRLKDLKTLYIQIGTSGLESGYHASLFYEFRKGKEGNNRQSDFVPFE